MKYLKTYELYQTDIAPKIDVASFLNEFGFFITLNLAKVSSMSKGESEKIELSKMLHHLNSPILNGKKYSEIIGDTTMIKNPRLLSALFTQIKGLIEYIEPRIEKYVIDGDVKSKWINKLNNFKLQYREILSQNKK